MPERFDKHNSVHRWSESGLCALTEWMDFDLSRRPSALRISYFRYVGVLKGRNVSPCVKHLARNIIYTNHYFS